MELPRQQGRRERLTEERGAGIHDAVLAHRVGGVTGHEDHLGFPVGAREPLGQLRPGHLGHDHVGKQALDGPRVGLGHAQGLLPVRGSEDGIAFRGGGNGGRAPVGFGPLPGGRRDPPCRAGPSVPLCYACRKFQWGGRAPG